MYREYFQEFRLIPSDCLATGRVDRNHTKPMKRIAARNTGKLGWPKRAVGVVSSFRDSPDRFRLPRYGISNSGISRIIPPPVFPSTLTRFIPNPRFGYYRDWMLMYLQLLLGSALALRRTIQLARVCYRTLSRGGRRHVGSVATRNRKRDPGNGNETDQLPRICLHGCSTMVVC